MSTSTTVGLRSERGPILLALMLATALIALDATILATAVPSIVDDLGGLTQFPWLFSVYLLAQAVSVPVYAKLADTVGRKPVILFGIGLFLIGSILCGFAWSMGSLIAMRALQGLGAGAVLPLTTTIAGWQFKAIAKQSVPDTDQLAMFFGTFNMIAGLMSLVLQLLLTARVLRTVGVGPSTIAPYASRRSIASRAAGSSATAVTAKPPGLTFSRVAVTWAVAAAGPATTTGSERGASWVAGHAKAMASRLRTAVSPRETAWTWTQAGRWGCGVGVALIGSPSQ